MPLIRRIFGAGLLAVALGVHGAALPESPDVVYGQLFAAVERAAVFPDQKTFCDCVPRGDPATLLEAYRTESRRPGFDLKAFVARHFTAPAPPPAVVATAPTLPDHIIELWAVLTRQTGIPPAGSSLLGLPHPFVVPGGRFREVYYWDSYFTMLGLRESGRLDLVRAMVENFAAELGRYGFIPNGNRTYYLSRSQPPFFAAMVELLAQADGPGVYATYREALRAEYAYWSDESYPTQHQVAQPNGTVLFRYWDRAATPRPESFARDEQLARGSPRPLLRDVRSAAESGWDFSSRWLQAGRTLATIRTTEIAPVDLNSLIYQLERTLAHAEAVTGQGGEAATLNRRADQRRAVLQHLFWAEDRGFFADYDLRAARSTGALTLAGMVPLFFGLATPAQAAAVAQTVERRFLRPGGVVTSLVATGQQWDAPNGWAPLEWMTVQGLRAYGYERLAAEIARRWIRLNTEVYQRTGRLMEKYNVEDPALFAGGGEYPSQDGFGWTNGVLLALLHQYPAEAADLRGPDGAPRPVAFHGSFPR